MPKYEHKLNIQLFADGEETPPSKTPNEIALEAQLEESKALQAKAVQERDEANKAIRKMAVKSQDDGEETSAKIADDFFEGVRKI